MARNIELKARLTDLASALVTAQRLATADLGVERQTDTYFPCRQGRLKLREIEGRPAQLVWYVRPDTVAAKASDYSLVPIAEPASLKAALSAALGVEATVVKERRIFLWRNVRIHLDQVAGLGEFLEFEAVLDADLDDRHSQEQLAWLSEQFQLRHEQLLAGSYRELGDAE
ncbi:MAG: class IV adenylate cyclase [Planctomycetes bacterium]|nr:class IV adenylate cyclase [Planctomycetota bacterium]